VELRGAVAVVTGASSGIGRATALRLADAGADLVLAGRRAEALDSLAAEVTERGRSALAVSTDVSDGAAVDALAARAVERFGRIDVWVNNAALVTFSPFLELPADEVRRVLDVNVMGMVHGSQAALRQMRAQERGVLVNVSSIVSALPMPYASPYSMSKAAVRSLSASLRQELRLEGVKDVHVVTVLPATIDTPLFHTSANHTGREVVPMPPVHDPSRVAAAIVARVRRPRREVIVGPAARPLLLQAKLAPALTERMLAVLVDRGHLSRTSNARTSSGNLFTPSDDPRDVAVRGGWGSTWRSARRLTIGAAVAAATGAAGVRALRR
jgi:short-subunit dehydrogenase